MRRTAVHRRLLAAVGGISIVTALVSGLGIRLTAQQYHDVEGVLLEGEKRSAAGRIPALVEHLARLEGAALDALARGGATREGATREGPEAARPTFLADPFVISTEGTISGPGIRAANGLSMLPEGRMPEEFLDSLRRALDRTEPEDRSRALASIAGRGDLGAPWRLRARLHAAADCRRRGDLGEALEIHRRIASEFADHFAHGGFPTRRHARLSHAETLEAAGRVDDAARILVEEATSRPARSATLGLDEEEFFLRRADRILSRAGRPSPPALRAARARLAGERRARADSEHLRDWIQDRLRIDGSRIPPGRPQHLFARFSGRLIPTVWTRVTTSSDAAGIVAVGFRLAPEGLLDLLQGELGREDGGTPVRVVLTDMESGDTTDRIPLVAFPGELAFLSLAIDGPEWRTLLGRQRRPFVLAGVLIGLLGLGVLLSLVAVFRSVRRELLLSRMKTEFVANVSHELKTPLALIRLCGETLLLDRARDDAQRKRYLQVVIRESVRLSQLITNVLGFASIEAGRTRYHLQPTDLAGVVRETVDNYRYHLQEKGFDLVEDVPDSLPTVRADGEAVTQALINLLQNAVRYSEETRRIEVTAGRVGDHVRISIRDRGVGIRAEEQDRVWEDYYRSAQVRAMGTRGSGLGLSLVRHIMNAHAGRVELESRPGEGSTFTLVFPVLGDDHPEAAT